MQEDDDGNALTIVKPDMAAALRAKREIQPGEFIRYFIREDVKLAQVVRARDYQSQGRHFDSGKTPKNRELTSTWIELHRP